MLPYIHIEPIRIGGITIGIFGLLVAVGCLSGYLVARREARLRGLDPSVIDGCLFWALIPGFFMSRLVELVFYHPEKLIAQPWALLNLWASMSSFGGFLGGTLGVVGYFLYTRKPVLAYAECLIVGFVVGWFFGRMGCSIVHDHPGALTDFPLGVRFPDGTRHDLGLYEWFFTVIVMIVVFTIPRFRLPQGVLLGAIVVAYALVRFPLDYLRVVDVRYGSLTAAQYGCMILFVIGVALVWRSLRARVPAVAH